MCSFWLAGQVEGWEGRGGGGGRTSIYRGLKLPFSSLAASGGLLAAIAIVRSCGGHWRKDLNK